MRSRRATFLPFCALILVAQGGGRGVEEARKALAGAPDPATRKEAAATLSRANEPAAVDALLDGLRATESRIAQLHPEKAKVLEEIDKFDLNKKIRPAPAAGGGAKGASGGAKGGGFVIDAGQLDKWEALQQRARDIEERIMAEETVHRAVVAALGAATDAAAVARMLKEAKNAGAPWSVRAALCEGIASVPGDGVADVLAERLAKDADARVRIAAAVALGRRAKPPPPEALLAGLQDKDWRVRSEVVRALAGYKNKPQVTAALVDAMEHEDGRLRGDVREALREITGLDKGGDPKSWKAWWQAQGAAGSPAAAGAVAPSGDTVVQYYGIPVTSKRLVFLLDHSGSMLEPAAWQGTASGAGSLPGSPKDGLPPLPANPPGGRKWDVAVWELSRVLYRLPPDAAFNIVCFDHEYTAWQPRLQKAAPAAKRSALEFLRGIQPAGLTNIFDPLEKAFAMGVGAGVIPSKAGPDDLDTVYIVTDGIPNLGQIPEPFRIVEKLDDMNRYRRITVHTIWVGVKPGLVRPPTPAGSPAPSDPEKERVLGELFLRVLAAETGGAFVSCSGDAKPEGQKAPAPAAGGPPSAAAAPAAPLEPLDRALERARREDKPVLCCFHMNDWPGDEKIGAGLKGILGDLADKVVAAHANVQAGAERQVSELARRYELKAVDGSLLLLDPEVGDCANQPLARLDEPGSVLTAAVVKQGIADGLAQWEQRVACRAALAAYWNALKKPDFEAYKASLWPVQVREAGEEKVKTWFDEGVEALKAWERLEFTSVEATPLLDKLKESDPTLKAVYKVRYDMAAGEGEKKKKDATSMPVVRTDKGYFVRWVY